METPAPISPPAAQPKNCVLAVWSLVLGILSLTCFSFLSGVPAVICGHTALGRIKRSSGLLTGEGLAIGGLVTGYLSLVLIPVIGLMAAIAIPNFVKARSTAMTNACINNLRQIDGAKQMWALEHKKQDTDLPTSQDLSPYLKKDYGAFFCPAGGTYQINSIGQAPTCSIPGHQLPQYQQ